MKALILALLLVSPAAARADIVFRCQSTGAGTEITANLRFDERGRSGRLELDRWTGYPPTPLVYADLKAPSSRNGRAVYPSEKDPNSGLQAEISLPVNFLKESDFAAMLHLVEPSRNVDYTLACERF